MDDVVSVYVTAGSEDAARALAKELLERRLVACANWWPMRSMYWWNGELEEADEVAMLLKTPRARLDDVLGAVAELHEYDVPCAVSYPIVAGHEPYLRWVREETEEKKE